MDVGHDIVRLQFQPIEGGHAVSGLQVDEYHVNESTIMSGSVSGMLLPLPKAYSLEQNYPNPFNPTTVIRYDVKQTGLVSVKVFDILGREVATLAYGTIPAGSYTVSWDATGQPSGIYLCRMEALGFSQTRKVILEHISKITALISY